MPDEKSTRLYEIRLVDEGKTLIYATAAATETAAADYGRKKMLTHSCDSAELWCGMRLLRRL